MNYPSDDQVANALLVARLAALGPTEYDRVRKEEAKKAGLRVGTLDDLVHRARAAGRSAATSNGCIDPTEDAVACAFAADNAGRLVYDHTAGDWFIWQNGRWTRDLRNGVFNDARDFARAARGRICDAPDVMSRIAFSSAVERAARADPKLAASHEIWDRDPWLLGTPGGVVDLRDGKMTDSTPDLYIRRHTTVAPAPLGTPAPLWRAYLASATGHDQVLQAFLQRLAGYLLTGIVSEEVLTFFYGAGGNGKGVFIGALSRHPW